MPDQDVEKEIVRKQIVTFEVKISICQTTPSQIRVFGAKCRGVCKNRPYSAV